MKGYRGYLTFFNDSFNKFKSFKPFKTFPDPLRNDLNDWNGLNVARGSFIRRSYFDCQRRR